MTTEDEMGGNLYISLTFAVLSSTVLASCGTTDLSGQPDSSHDPVAEDLIVEDLAAEDTAEPEPSCWDHDEDGYFDEACGGDDCDDDDPAVYPGAPELCLDGVDQDCDGSVDGPLMMTADLQVSSNPIVDTGAMFFSFSWTGSEYLLSWYQNRETVYDGDFFLSRVSSEGDHVIDRLPMANLVVAAWSGSQIGLSWEQEEGIYFKLLDPVGEILVDDVQICERDAYAYPIRIMWKGDRFGLFWMDNPWLEDIAHAHVSTEGEVLAGPFLATDSLGWYLSEPGMPSMSWTGSATGLAWYDESSDVPGDSGIYFSSLPDDATAAAGFTKVMDVNWPSSPAIVWTGAEFGVVWSKRDPTDMDGFQMISMDNGGEVSATNDIYTDHETVAPFLAWTGSEYGLLYMKNPTEDSPSLVFMIVSADELAHENHIEIPGNWFVNYDLVWSGSEFGIARIGSRDGRGELLFNRIGLCD